MPITRVKCFVPVDVLIGQSYFVDVRLNAADQLVNICYSGTSTDVTEAFNDAEKEDLRLRASSSAAIQRRRT